MQCANPAIFITFSQFVLLTHSVALSEELKKFTKVII